MKSFIILACVFALSGATVFRDCGSYQATPKSVDLTGCPDELNECLLEGDATKTVVIEFEMTEDEETFMLYQKTNAWWQKYNVPNKMPKDACKDNGVDCPLKNGETYTYTGEFTIDYNSEDPKPSELKFQWMFMDENKNHQIMCVELDNNIG